MTTRVVISVPDQGPSVEVFLVTKVGDQDLIASGIIVPAGCETTVYVSAGQSIAICESATKTVVG